MRNARTTALITIACSFLITGCASVSDRDITVANTHFAPGIPLQRAGDEIMVCGQLFHTGTPVVLWTDPGGYDAYRTERRFVPIDEAQYDPSRHEHSPNRYGVRKAKLTDEELERVRGGGWDLPTLQRVVDQFVIHYDVCGTSQKCFHILHDRRNLSVHFMLDIDGTIYQTLDLKERAWHATIANGRSIGIEIANIGAYSAENKSKLDEWYATDADGRVTISLPEYMGDGGVRTPNFVGAPVRQELVVGDINGRTLHQYDLTPEQYEALINLTATLCSVFPKLDCAQPTDAAGRPVDETLSREDFDAYRGLIGHYHVQKNKVDPGPAFQWDYVISEAKRRMNPVY